MLSDATEPCTFCVDSGGVLVSPADDLALCQPHLIEWNRRYFGIPTPCSAHLIRLTP